MNDRKASGRPETHDQGSDRGFPIFMLDGCARGLRMNDSLLAAEGQGRVAMEGGRSIRVLVVDDYPDNVESIDLLLSEAPSRGFLGGAPRR